jgi:hypothetical protein
MNKTVTPPICFITFTYVTHLFKCLFNSIHVLVKFIPLKYNIYGFFSDQQTQRYPLPTDTSTSKLSNTQHTGKLIILSCLLHYYNNCYCSMSKMKSLKYLIMVMVLNIVTRLMFQLKISLRSEINWL